MGWGSAVKKRVACAAPTSILRPTVTPWVMDWERLVCIDFETFYSDDYTLSKLSTSEYVRDKRFKAQCMGIKVGSKKTKVVPHNKIKAELAKINWETHSLLCHNVQFDGFILSHHYGVHPAMYHCTMGMARGLHSNEIGASLDEVSVFYGGGGKIHGALEQTKNVLNWTPSLYKSTALYCANDVDEMHSIFVQMHPNFPSLEMYLVHMTARMFCAPVLRVDLPRVEKELKRELDRRQVLFEKVINPEDYKDEMHLILKTKDERALTGVERMMKIVKKIIGSNERFADLIRECGVEPPKKISPAWMKLKGAEREERIEDKYTYAFAKDDLEFQNLANVSWEDFPKLDPNDVGHLMQLTARRERLQELYDVRVAVKSTTNITRAERFLKAGENGQPLPVGYAYARAHTLRWGGNNKMNMQNLTRGGELRLSILADKGHQMAVADSGQIEARVNGWLWGQDDLMAAFRVADADPNAGAKGLDAYCRFATLVYGRHITKADTLERFVGKVCVLGLGFSMGAAKFQLTLAKGALGGPPVHFPFDQCQQIINTYRRANHKIVAGWKICTQIIEDMAAGRSGSHKCISWEEGRIWLPNGLCLKYPNLIKQAGEKGYDEWSYLANAEKNIRKKIYGGLLCENLVQALARIIVAEQMVAIDKKYPIVMTTHDEAVAHPKTKEAPKCFDWMTKCMSTAPHWCSDIPLACEGGFASNYSK